MELPPLPEPAPRRVEMQGQSFLVQPTPGMYSAEEVRSYASECMRLAVEEERERQENSVAKLIAGWDGPYRRAGDLVLLSIRVLRHP